MGPRLLLAIALAAAVGIVLGALLPRLLVRRAQDRLAAEIQGAGAAWQLLTRADLITGRWRRIPGVLGLRKDVVEFHGLFGESVTLATSGIARIRTGRRLANGRLLFRLEALGFESASGERLELILTHAAAFAWRSHLGAWAARERQADADRVVPGKA
ncbi:MAG TPA: hypothetical protein VIE39_03310 [Thermoanaerobaculia bacterium]|jgi:hypothetical protein